VYEKPYERTDARQGDALDGVQIEFVQKAESKRTPPSLTWSMCSVALMLEPHAEITCAA
jgi:hypothetical protein